MKWKRVRTQKEIRDWFFMVDQELKSEGHVAQRIPDLRKTLNTHDEPALLGFALFIISGIREDLTKGTRVSEIREALGVVQTILSFCGRVEAGDLTPYVKE